MPDPHDALVIFAEVSVALAGFSGIAIALARRRAGELTPLEARRLFNLFAFSGLVLVQALTSITVLQGFEANAENLWAAQSAFTLLFGVPWLYIDWRKVLRLAPEERRKVPALIFYPFNLLAVVVMSLQVFNIFRDQGILAISSSPWTLCVCVSRSSSSCYSCRWGLQGAMTGIKAYRAGRNKEAGSAKGSQ